MNIKRILVVEEDPQTLKVVEQAFADLHAGYEICRTTDEAWKSFHADPEARCVLVRMQSNAIDGCELTRRIRRLKPAESLPVIMIVGEDQIESAGSAVEAGATDIMLDPFEPRELRMRAGIVANGRRSRIDEPHQYAVAGEQEISDSANFSEPTRLTAQFSSVVSPVFDSQSRRFIYDATESQLARWQEDPAVTKIELDKILVCPCCEGIPTFRMGCGCCGSAMTEPDVLIHHYACAHVEAESGFRKGQDLVCPKCRQKNLVAGSDFEMVTGGQVCADCGERCSQSELIGHCLSCQHRFPAHEAATKVLVAYHVHRVQEIADLFEPQVSIPTWSAGVRPRVAT